MTKNNKYSSDNATFSCVCGISPVKFHRSTLPLTGTDSLEAELRQNRPVKVGWKIPGSNIGHLVLVYGFEDDGVAQTVLVSDPTFDKPRKFTFAELKNAANGEIWVWTWTGLG